MPSYYLFCAVCEKRMNSTKHSLPQGQATCRACRNEERRDVARPVYDHNCQACSVAFSSSSDVRKYCSTLCANRHKAQRVRSDDDPRVRRFQREQAAAGLSQRARKNLLARWVRQQRPCTYCDGLATTIDHVLPLVRGGTNYEGNLTPCCRPCNGSKAGWTVIEWRTGRRLAPMKAPLAAHRSKRKPLKPQVVTVLSIKTCPVCSTMHDRVIYCSQRCCSIASERRKTDRKRKPERTACPQGHPYTPENRRVRVRVRNGVSTTETECAVCNREKRAAKRAA